MKDRYRAFNEKTAALLFRKGWLRFMASMVILLNTHQFLNAQCTIDIESVQVSCNYSSGTNAFTVAVEVSWSSAPGPAIEVAVGGQTETFTPAAGSGSHVFTGFSLPGPGFGYPVTAQFTGLSDCRDFSTADAIACTPACPDSPSSVGGTAWNDVVADGIFAGEPGQPNIKVEAYDCAGMLQGAAFTNADGQWSISGLNAREAYRIEFSTRQAPGVYPSLAGPDNRSPVQFVYAGDCSVNAAFMEQSASDCSLPGNEAAPDCSGAPHTLDWSAYPHGANPFPLAPFSVSFGEDKIYWARTNDDATSYAHKVYHSPYGGADAYYYLEMDADDMAPGADKDIGVVFAFNHPVAELTFSLLDIDISGNAIDRVSVQGSMGGAPVKLSLSDIAAGSKVSVLEPYLYEGTATVGDDSQAGNVTIRFQEPVDQLAIHLSAAASAGSDPDVQGIGIGNISWCRGPAALSPECTRIFDWLGFTDNDSNPTPYDMEEVAVEVTKKDPFGIAAGSVFMVDNDFSPQGGQRGFWAIGMDAANPNQYVESAITFSQPVSQLCFSILDIDQGDGPQAYQDKVSVRAYLSGVEVPLGLSDITAGAGMTGGGLQILSPNEYLADGMTANGASADGNISLRFRPEVDSIVIRLAPGPDGPANPAAQQIGLSDINFCICKPAPLQIGDLAWEDENGNGVQEACEPPIANLPVTLYDAAGARLATALTDADGRYHFTRAGASGEDWATDGQLQPNTPYFLVFGNAGNTAAGRYIRINDRLYVPTIRQAGQGSNPFMNDSDIGPDAFTANMPGSIPDGLPYIAFSTGDAGQANHTLDAGFVNAWFDLALRKTLNEDLTPPPFSPGDAVTYTVTVYNQGMAPTSYLNLVDYYPAEALELESGGDWFYNDEGVAFTRLPLPEIAPGDSLSLNINFKIKTTFTGNSILNAAEIANATNDLGLDDIDSTPDNLPDNDAGGAPGSEADNAILGDGSGAIGGTDAVTDEDDHDVERIIVNGAAAFDLALDLTLNGDGPFYPGSQVAFSIELVNEGLLDGTAVRLNSYIPGGLLLDDPDWTQANNVASLNVPVDLVPIGGSVFREITFQVAPGFLGDTIFAVVEIAGAVNADGEADYDSTPANQNPDEDDQDSEPLPVSPVFDLSLKKELVSPGPFSPGSQVTFSIIITNEGTTAAQNVQISDFIPAGLILVPNNWSVNNGVARLNTPIPSIAPGNTATRQIIFTIDPAYQGASITNWAEIFAAANGQGLADRDSNPGNSSNQEDDDDSATFTIQQPAQVFDLALKKEIDYSATPGPFEPGSLVRFLLTLTNEGNVRAKNIQLADYLPDGMSLEDNAWVPYGNLAVTASSISSLDGGQSVTVPITMRIDDDFTGTEISNRAEIYFAINDNGLDDQDSSPDNGMDNAEDDLALAIVPVQQQAVVFDLALRKKVNTAVTPGPFYPGSIVTYTIRVINEGLVTADAVSIIDYIPQQLILEDPGWTQVFGSAMLNTPITNLEPGATASVDITFRIKSDFTGYFIDNLAEINSATNAFSMADEDSYPANGQQWEDDADNAKLLVQQSFDLALSKTVNTELTPGPYVPGGQVTFNLTVYNQGSLTASNIRLYDYFPPGLILNDNNWQYIQGNILRLANPIPSLAPGQSTTVTITFNIASNVANGASLLNCAELGSSTNVNGAPDIDSTPGNGSHYEDDDDTETIVITIPKTFDLALEKSVKTSATPGPYYPGSTVTYSIRVTNEGEEAAQNIQIQDYIPQGLILISSDWSALGGVAMRNSPIASLAPGASATVEVTFAISPGFTGTSLTNYAEIGSNSNGSNLNDTDSTPGNGSAGPGEDDYDGATITVSRQIFDLALSKQVKTSATPGPFVPGSTVTFKIDIANEGDLTAQNIQLREYIPAGLILADPNWNAVGNVAELALPIASLAPGAIASVDVRFTVASNFSGASLTNYAEVGSAFNILGYDDTDSTPGNGSLGPNEDDYDGATITVLQQEFDLALNKELKVSATPGPFFPGSTVTFRITTTNEGDLEAQNIQLRDYIPLGLVLADNNWTLNGSMAVRNIGSLQAGASATVDITFTVSPNFSGSSLVNFAEVGAATNSMGLGDKDSTPGNGSAGANEDDFDNAAITVLPAPFDLALTKELKVSATPGPFVPGSTVTFRLTVTNQGGIAAQNIQVRDYIPLGLGLADNNWTLNGSMAVRNIGSLQPGASATVDITFTVSPSFSGQQLVNYAEIGAATNTYGLGDLDSTPGNGPSGPNEDDYDSAAITIVSQPFDLALTKELKTSATPGPFVPGSTVTYQLTITNQGGIAAQSIQLWDYIPLGLILADNNWSSNGNLATRSIGALAPGSSTTVDITFTIAANFSGAVITNYAEIGAATNNFGLSDTDSTPGNSSNGANEDDFDGAVINVVQQLFDLALTKELKTSATPGPFYPGSTVTFRITVTNEGGIAAQNIQVRDYIPLGLVLADNNWTLNGSMAYRMIGNLQPGASATVDITFTISPNFSGSFITNFAEIGAAANAPGLGDTDSTPGNGSAGANEDDFDNAGIIVGPPLQFDLALSKSVSSSTPGPYVAGSPVTFRLTVTNQGNVAAQSIQLRDYLPLGLTLSDNTWTANGAVASFNTPIASLAPGASQTVEIDFVVAQGFGGSSITNFAEIHSASNSQGLNDVDSTPGNGAAGPNEDDYSSAGITINVTPVFDLALSKSVSSSTPGPYQPGSPVTFRLRVTNQGNVTAQSIQLYDYIPAGLALADNTWAQNGNLASLNTPIASLAPGAMVDVEIDFVVAQGFGGMQIVNHAEIAAAFNGSGLNDTDSTPGNGAAGPGEDDYDDSSITIDNPQIFDLALSKSVSSSTPGPYQPGSPVTFRLRVFNQGEVTAQNIQLRDYIPAGLTLADNTWAQNGNVANLNTPIASLAPGAMFDVEIDFVVAQGFSGQIVNFGEIAAAANGSGLNDVDSTPGNGAAGPGEDDYDDSSITVSVTPRFDLALRKQLKASVTPGPFAPGSPVTFRITVFNQGNIPAYNIQITDYIPAGLTLSGSGWTQSGARATRTIPGPIAAGSNTAVDISFVINQNFTGSTIVNYAEISAADDDTNPGNTPPTDVDSPYDNNGGNDAGGQPNSPADDAIDGNGTGQPGSSQAAGDEDDHDPALITVGNCPSAGSGGSVDVCLTCTSNNVFVNLTGALGGNPSPGGSWADLDGAGVSLANPSSVNFTNIPSGDYRFRYTVGGQGGCPASSATVTVSLASNLDYGCDNQVNVPFGNSNCQVLVTPDMVLEGGSGGCSDGLVVNLIGPMGENLGNIITGAQAGQTLIAEVLDPYCGLVCWGTVYVQDFTPPSFTCPVQNVDLICSDLDSILNNPASLAITGQPLILDTCVQNTVTFQDQVVMTPDCADRRINRVFTVTDPVGNSAQCTQVIIIRKPTFNDLIAPPALTEIPCDSAFATDQNGNPHPSVSGFPLVQTYFGNFPLNQTFCNLGATYTDSPPIVICDGTVKIVRHWEILDWCSSSGNNLLELSQIIKVGDVAGPLVSCPEMDYDGDGQPDPLEFNTSPYACTASFQAPLPNVVDNCSTWEVRTEIVRDDIVPVTNQYGIIIRYDTVATVIATILPGAPRQVNNIPLGCYRFRYKVTDDCNNYTVVECDFCVVDRIEPTAVCNDSLNISIGGQGFGRVYATDVDEGSNDNCGIDSLLVRRLYTMDPLSCSPVTPYYSAWGPYIDFTCCDVNQSVTIELRVVDIHGNENTCWLNVLVEDKVRPICTAPQDVSVSCNALPDNFDPYNTGQLQALFGAATAQDACGSAIATEQAPNVNLSQCGFGTIIRTFRAVDLVGNVSQNLCRQVVTISQEFNYEIKFPKDFTTNCSVPTPDTVIYTSFGCDLLAVSVTDEVFTPLSGSTGPECYKIFRKYRVLNWCEYDGLSDAVVVGRNEDCDGFPGDEDVWVLRRPGHSYIDRDNNHTNNIPAFGTKGTSCDGTTNPTGYWRTATSVGLWEYTQIIKVMDNTPPQISFTPPAAFCSYDAVNCEGQVSYPFTIAEDCSPTGLEVQVFLDAGADGLIDQDLTNSGALSGAYPNYSIQGEFPLGNHAFIVRAEDGCGNNMAEAILPFQVVDCQPPAFSCLNGLSFPLTLLPPNTDFDGDGDIDVAGAAIWANDFVLNATDCSDDTIAYSINRVGEAPDINRRGLYFTCEDTGTIAIQIYVWDSANNPHAVQPDGTMGGHNYGFCDTYVIVQNNNNVCSQQPMMAGLIAREDNMGVEGVEVSLSGPVILSMNTLVNGTYQFDGLETGYDYTIRPYLNTGHRNGVSTLDLLIIQQHLLGVQPLSSPYKRIAADANRSGSITTLDMIQIQQLILGTILEFPNNTSWRFVDKDFIFPVPTNPWFTTFPELINVNDLAMSMMAQDFVAIKIGDVNNSAQTTNLLGVEGRSFGGTFYLRAPEMQLKSGEIVEVPLSAEKLEAIRGYQFTLDFDQSALELVDVEYGLADKACLGLHGLAEGYLTASWYRKDGIGYPEEEPFFTLIFRAKADAELAELLRISSRYTAAEAYTPEHELLDVALAFGKTKPGEAGAFRLYQNRPNPFSREAIIGFELPEDGLAVFSVFDINGRLVYQQEGHFSKGYQELALQREALSLAGSAAGLLYYRLQMGDRVATRKMILLE